MTFVIAGWSGTCRPALASIRPHAGKLVEPAIQGQAFARLVEVPDDLGNQPVHLKLLFGRPSIELGIFASETDLE